MNRLIDKLCLLALCIIICGMFESFEAPVVALLLSVGLSTCVQFLTGALGAACIIGCCSVMCCFFPAFFCAAPIMLYDALWEKKPWLAVPCLGAVLSMESFRSEQLLLIAACLLAAFVLYKRTSDLEETRRRFIETRDESAEKNLLLAKRNKQLVNSQDNEIYLATLQERNRIAREIHDNVGHMLTRSILQVGAVSVINKDENLKDALESLKNTLDTAMTGIRCSVHNLHDDSIDLRQAVEDSLGTLKDKFSCTLDYDVSENVPRDVKLAVIGIVKESVSNIAKHSSGNKVKVSLREHPAFYQLAVEDNGRCSEIEESGIGLSNMQDRAASIGGIIRFTPSEKGFRVFMSAPKKGE